MRFDLTRYLLFAGMLVVMTGMPSALMAQSSRDLANRLDHLENEIETLNHAVYRGAESGASVRGIKEAGKVSVQGKAGNAEVRIQQMETEVRSLRGQLEEQGYKIRQLEKQVETLNSDVGTRLGDLEKTESTSSSSLSDSNSVSNSNSVSKPDSFTFSSSSSSVFPEQGDRGRDSRSLDSLDGESAAGLYENAFSLLKAANYDRAGSEFEEFLTKYPDHVLSGNAKYWLGETYYVRGQFDLAARIFAEGFQKYPNGAKAADNLLKLGMSLANLKKVEDACVALAQLLKDDYKNAGPVVRRGEQERVRLKCGE